jgi:hypothetical protein
MLIAEAATKIKVNFTLTDPWRTNRENSHVSCHVIHFRRLAIQILVHIAFRQVPPAFLSVGSEDQSKQIRGVCVFQETAGRTIYGLPGLQPPAGGTPARKPSRLSSASADRLDRAEAKLKVDAKQSQEAARSAKRSG